MHEQFMKRCLELASKGMGKVSPNPMVGAVVVHEGKIIGEGFHSEFGKPHAEVEAIHSVVDKSLLDKSVLYVNLEPCNHHGKTPPCTDLIIENKIPEMIICNLDPNPLVAGKGINRLKENGINVINGILEKEGEFLNRRFFTFHRKKRPYIILKWAMTKDSFIDLIRKNDSPEINKISSDLSHQLSHRWRSEEDAILIGKNTALKDDPELTNRLHAGKNPIRILIDKNLEVPSKNKIFNSSAETIILNSKKDEKIGNLNFVKMNSENYSPMEISSILYAQNIQSLIIEGGSITLQKFIDENHWDEARIFISSKIFKEGIKAPEFPYDASSDLKMGDDILKTYYKK